MITNICVMQSGGEFNASHVHRLAKQVPNLVCLSDIKIPGIKTIQLDNKWPSWWCKMNMFSPKLKGDLMYFDLDTLIVKMPAMPSVTTVLTDFGDSNVIGSGLMFLKEADKAQVWNDWLDNPKAHINAHIKWPAGDQGFLLKYYKNAQRWQDVANVYSWKYHCAKGVPKDADVVCFHGKPRPWDIGV